MRTASIGPCWGALLASACAVAAEPVAGALEWMPSGAQVLHCGVSQGVLYVSYVREQRTIIAPAFHTPAIRKACAQVGHALAAGPSTRAAAPIVAPRIGAAPTAPPGAVAGAPSMLQPSFVAQASGSVIRIDGRNDADVAHHCVFNFAWIADDPAGGSRGVTAQATLPARQSQRVVTLSGPYNHLRFVGPPRWHCTPGG
jgi:hypothetical protein